MASFDCVLDPSPAFIAAFGTDKIPQFTKGDVCFAMIFPPILGLVHTVWIIGLRRAYTLDKREEGDFREAMRIDACYREDQCVTCLRNQTKASWWNQAAQVAMTWTLTILAMFMISRFP